MLQPPAKGTAKVLIWDGEQVLAEVERVMPAGERRVDLKVDGLTQMVQDGKKLQVLASLDAEGKLSAAAAAVS